MRRRERGWASVCLVVVLLVASACTGSSPATEPTAPPTAYDLTGQLTMARCDPVDQVSILDEHGSVVATTPVSVPAGTACHVAFTVRVPAAEHYQVQLGDQARLSLTLGSAQTHEWSGGVSGTIRAEPVAEASASPA